MSMFMLCVCYVYVKGMFMGMFMGEFMLRV